MKEEGGKGSNNGNKTLRKVPVKRMSSIVFRPAFDHIEQKEVIRNHTDELSIKKRVNCGENDQRKKAEISWAKNGAEVPDWKDFSWKKEKNLIPIFLNSYLVNSSQQSAELVKAIPKKTHAMALVGLIQKAMEAKTSENRRFLLGQLLKWE